MKIFALALTIAGLLPAIILAFVSDKDKWNTVDSVAGHVWLSFAVLGLLLMQF